MTAVPVATPVRIPLVAPIVATEVVLLLHNPPGMRSEKVPVLPTQIPTGATIGKGASITVTVVTV